MDQVEEHLNRQELDMTDDEADMETSKSDEKNANDIDGIDNCTKGPTTVADTTLDPFVGMEFESAEAAYLFYNDYARCVGFGIRKRFIRRSRSDNEVIARTYVCAREGQKYINKRAPAENPRANTRSDCKARLAVKKTQNEKWCLQNFINEHNHELHPQSARFFRSQSHIASPEKNVIKTLYSVGIKVPKIMATIAKHSGGIKSVNFTEKDCKNLIQKEKRESFSVGDAQAIYEFFEKSKKSDPGFFYDMELEDGKLRNVFWIDARSRMSYDQYGDVITFDTTFLTNKYAMKFAPFVGVNHHGQSVLLGCALLSDETKSSFLWVFRAWLTAMQNKAPKAIITDQDKAIRAAIREAFPDICHRYCLWHIMRKVPEKLGSVCKAYPSFMYKFHKCIYDSLTVEEFEERWKCLIETYGLIEHTWLQPLYECRTQWIPVFLKDTFFAGMSTSQRSESINSFFDGYFDRKTFLQEFVKQYHLALQKRYNDEEKADHDNARQSPHLKTGSPYEAQMACLYTSKLFKKFQDEVLLIPSCHGLNTQFEGNLHTHVVREFFLKLSGKNGTKDYKVVWDASKATVSCICRLFEFKGYICRHVMAVLLSKGVYEIPLQYILKRWCKDAKNTILFVEDSHEVKEDSEEFKSKCFLDLCAYTMKVAEKGSSSTKKYEVTRQILRETLEKLATIEDEEATRIGSISTKLQSKRLKSGVEERQTKPRRCSNCRQPGHCINKCKEVCVIHVSFVIFNSFFASLV
ncbi:hypothetical protein ACHQM5_026753 [Ranunculus cassubicifolius]